MRCVPGRPLIFAGAGFSICELSSGACFRWLLKKFFPYSKGHSPEYSFFLLLILTKTTILFSYPKKIGVFVVLKGFD